jgi:hypothetical protein
MADIYVVMWRVKILLMPVPVLNGTKLTRTRTRNGIESAPKRLRTWRAVAVRGVHHPPFGA